MLMLIIASANISTAGCQVLMMQEVISQHSRADWSTDVEVLGRLVCRVFCPKMGRDLKQEKKINGL